MAENIFPNLGNEKLIAAMEAVKSDENKETQNALIQAVLASKYFAPVEIFDKDGNKIEGTGKMEIPKDAKFNFRLIKNTQGEAFFTLFTDIPEYQKWNKEQKIGTIVVVFPQIAQLILSNKDDVKGFVINPMGQNIVFTKETIANILNTIAAHAAKQKAEKEAAQVPEVVQEETAPTFEKPSNVPDSVLESLKKSLKKHSEVKSAYFAMMKKNGKDNYLFVIDADADDEKKRKINDSFAATAKLFLTKYPVIAASGDISDYEGAKSEGVAFYEAE
jgi:hypothetical protein